MTPARPIRIAIPLSLTLLLLLAAAYLLPGLADHDPWKSDDAIAFGIVFEALHGNWLVPTLAGEPYPDVSPLYFWLATIFAQLFSGVLPLHGAARLASGACAALAIACTAIAARELFGAAAAGSAALILIGCVGLLLQAHSMSAEIALFAAIAAVLLGVALAGRRPLAGAAIAGSGIGASFLAQGLAPAIAGILLALAMVLGRSDTRRRALAYFGVLLLFAAPWFAIWPAVLYLTAPQRLAEWWNAVTAAQLPASDAAQPLRQAFAYLKLLGWYAWPALPLALWTLWLFRRRLAHAGIALPALAFVLLLVMLSLGRDARDVTALPLLLPLTLLGAAAVGDLRRGAANALDWFGIMTFSLFALVIWAGYFAMQTGIPEEFAQRFIVLEPGYAARFDALALAAALLLTLCWIALLAFAERSPYRGITRWAAGMTLSWGLLAALWLPWIDYGKSYRGMSAALAPHVAQEACVASRNLGEPQRASLHYFAGLVTRRAEVTDSNCRLMLVQGSANDDSGNPGAGWDFLWQGNRPGDRSERYRLYRRQP